MRTERRWLQVWLVVICCCGLACSSKDTQPRSDAGAAANGGSTSAAGSAGNAQGSAGSAGDTPSNGAAISGGFNGTRLDLSTGGIAAYSPSGRRFFMTGATADGSTVVDLYVLGDANGHYTCGSDSDGGIGTSVLCSTNGAAGAASYSSTDLASLTPCDINVTELGAPGEHVRGTFSATLVATSRTNASGSTALPQTMQITDGAFDIVRSADIP